MPIAPAVGIPLSVSLPTVGYYYEFTGLTEDGTTKNTCVMDGLTPDFVVNRAYLFVNAIGTGTPQGAYASYDRTTLAKDATDKTKVNIDIYLKSGAGGASVVGVLLV